MAGSLSLVGQTQKGRFVGVAARAVGRPRVGLTAAAAVAAALAAGGPAAAGGALFAAVPAVPGTGPGDPVDLGRGVPQRGADVVEPYLARSRDVRPRPAVNGCVGRYVADAEFIGQLPVRQAVHPPRP
jgi:hypothetical protein